MNREICRRYSARHRFYIYKGQEIASIAALRRVNSAPSPVFQLQRTAPREKDNTKITRGVIERPAIGDIFPELGRLRDKLQREEKTFERCAEAMLSGRRLNTGEKRFIESNRAAFDTFLKDYMTVSNP